MTERDKLTAEKLRLLSLQNATGYGLYLLGFTEALRLRDYVVATPICLPSDPQHSPQKQLQ
ncbi:MAG: hypothetical protein IKU86_06285 [Thermoguttaceae bacterium]|nr:hypothetical protein [Thermoguttaceae bacterium]